MAYPRQPPFQTIYPLYVPAPPRIQIQRKVRPAAGVLSTPAFSLTADTTTGTITVAVSSDGAIYHEIWRAAAGEYSGAAVLINNLLVPNGSYIDANVGSGVTYAYYIVGVDGSGNRSTSATQTASVTLGSAFLADVTKFSASLSYVTLVALNDLIPHTRQYQLDSAEYQTANATLPTIGISSIEQNMIQLVARVRSTADSQRASLRSIYGSRRYVCLRDIRGNKFFGRLETYEENYGHGFTDINLSVEVTSYSESIV